MGKQEHHQIIKEYKQKIAVDKIAHEHDVPRVCQSAQPVTGGNKDVICAQRQK